MRLTGAAAFCLTPEAVAYERSVFAPEAGNWPAHRLAMAVEPAKSEPCAWWHGAAGIGLARLGGLPALDTAEIRQDIDMALQT